MIQLRNLLVMATFVVGAFVDNARGAQSISADFDFGYGIAAGTPNGWNDSENAANNTPTSQGDFTLSPTVTGRIYSTAGPFFSNRTLTGVPFGGGFSGFVRDGNSPIEFSVTLTGSYTGLPPVNVNLLSPGYQITLEITELSLYGASEPCCGGSPTTMAWEEATAGHSQTSPAVNLLPILSGDQYGNAANYTQLVWDAPDYAEPIAGPNIPFSRSFELSPSNLAVDYRVIDGLEMKGRVILTYNAIPEPNAAFLAGAGIVALVGAYRLRGAANS